jgi:BNR/Asp-box repeat
MTDPRDRIDDWLNGDVEPLTPPPGTFDRIQHRARRRKASRAVMSAAGIAVVIAAAVTVPQIVSTLQNHGSQPGRPVAAGTQPASVRPTVSGKGAGSPNSRSSSEVTPSGSALSATASVSPVPANFRPTSVTFIGPDIGAVIGQARSPGHCATAFCTSLAGTSDYGTTWYGVSAPLTGAPDGSSGVGQIRFLNLSDGWAFGPQLWATTDGGATWTQERTYGMRVTDLETVGDRAFALFASCTGSGAAYAADCTKFSLYTSRAGSGRWQPVPGVVSDLVPSQAGAQGASASLVLTGGPTSGRGYLLAPSGELFSGPLTGAAWSLAGTQEQCLPGTPGPDGQPTGALLAADSAGLVLVCTSATDATTGSQTKSVIASQDNGTTWSAAQSAEVTGIASSVATQGSSLVVLATSTGLYLSANGGGTWQLAQASPGGAAAGQGGFSYVGMTSTEDGVALPADAGLHEVFVTTDGGRTWQAHAVSQP